MDIAQVKETLEYSGVIFEPGLSAQELALVEETFDFTFPPDLAELLRYAVPVSHGFINWRRGECAAIRDMVDWPFDGFCKDIENNSFWHDNWGERPMKLSERFRKAGQILGEAPTLIPICGHRFIPESPHEAGNPVFSVYQSDIICYGHDLWDYLTKELRCDLGYRNRPATPKEIPFWSGMVVS